MNRYLSIVLFLTITLVPESLFSGWVQTYGTVARDDGEWVEQTVDSGFIICGTTYYVEDKPYFTGGYLIKTDSAGEAAWIKTYLGDNASAKFRCVQRTMDKGYIMAGETINESIDKVWWLVKTDSMGDTLWTREYGEEDVDKAWSVRQLPDSGFIIAGSTESMSDARRALWVLRTDSQGDTIWSRTYGEGEVNHWAYCVNPTSDSGFVLTGGHGLNQRLWLLKIDDNGDTLWTKQYGRIAWGKYVEETADSGFIITGANMESSEVYVLKTDENGDSIWSTRLWGAGENEGCCIRQTPDGGYILGALHNYNSSANTADAWLVKLDENGDTLWSRTYGRQDRYGDITCVELTADGGYALTGRTDTKDPDKSYEIWLIKTDSLGYLDIEEFDNPPKVQVAGFLETQITLYYENLSGGFRANVYNSSGQKVTEIHNPASSGTVTWGQGYSPGVYFIKEVSGNQTIRKIVLVR